MTAREIERIAKLEQKVDDLNEKVDAGFQMIMDRLDKRNQVLQWTIGTIVALLGAVAILWEVIVRK